MRYEKLYDGSGLLTVSRRSSVDRGSSGRYDGLTLPSTTSVVDTRVSMVFSPKTVAWTM